MSKQQTAYPVSHVPFRGHGHWPPMRRWMRGFFSEAPDFQTPDFWMHDDDIDWVPAINLVEKEDRLSLEVDLPGVRKDDVKISLEGDILWLRGERRLEDEGKQNYYCCERLSGTFSRRVRLPVKIEEDRIDTSLKDGVLTVMLPKAKEMLPKEIKIS
jgi:HSP20 family protein